MSMTKKDYELLAEVLNNCYEAKQECNTATVTLVAEVLADHLQLDNPRFDRNRFLTACGVTQ